MSEQEFFDELRIPKLKGKLNRDLVSRAKASVDVYVKNLMEKIRKGEVVHLRGKQIASMEDLFDETEEINKDFGAKIDTMKLLNDIDSH